VPWAVVEANPLHVNTFLTHDTGKRRAPSCIAMSMIGFENPSVSVVEDCHNNLIAKGTFPAAISSAIDSLFNNPSDYKFNIPQEAK
jgi:hypothetical protein